MTSTFVVSVEQNALIFDSKKVVLGHHFAATLLAALVEAANRSQSLQGPALMELLHQKDPRTVPDRTAIARALQAVQKAVASVTPEGGSRVTYAARCKTVGPWRLAIAKGELWQIQPHATGDAALSDCFLQFCEPSGNWVKGAQALALADDFMVRGKYAECREILVNQHEKLLLTDCARSLWMLRIVRCCQRLGDSERAKLWSEQIQPLVPKLKGVFARHVAAELFMLDERRKFNAQPVASSLAMAFDGMVASAQSAPSALLLTQAENLKGLALRRLVAARVAKGLDCAGDVKNVLLTTSTAYFWACVAQDGYYQQAVATNMGYLLHWLSKHGLHDGWQTSLQWFALARTLVDRFELPQDSAWDHVMVGTAYMESLEARAGLRADVLAWPDDQGPDTEAFYLRGLQLAQTFGDARQRIMTLDLMAQHYQYTGNLLMLAETRAAWAVERLAHPTLVQDMALDN